MSYLAYLEYEESGISWIGRRPRHWQVRRMKECGRLVGGAGFPIEEQGITGEELPFYKVADLKEATDGRNMVEADHSISRETAYRLRASIVPRNAVVYAKIGAALLLNRRRLTSSACCIDNNMTAFISDSNCVIPLWAYYWLTNINFAEFTNPGAVPSFSEGDQGILPICVPPLPEQRQIAAFLDWKTGQIDALIAKKKQLLEKLKEKRLAVITQAVTRGLNPTVTLKDSGIPWLGMVPQHWEVVRFSFFIGFQEGPGIMAVDFRDEGVPLLRIRNVQSDIVDLDGCNFLDSEMVETRWSSYRCKVDDLLISCSASTGLVSEVDEAASGSIAYTGIIRLWPQGNAITKDFIRWLVSSDLFLWQCKLLQTGSTMLHFGPAHLNQMRMTLPPVDEQKVIVEHLTRSTGSIDALVESNLRMIATLTEYRTALITAATTGKIDVRGVEIPDAGLKAIDVNDRKLGKGHRSGI